MIPSNATSTNLLRPLSEKGELEQLSSLNTNSTRLVDNPRYGYRMLTTLMIGSVNHGTGAERITQKSEAFNIAVPVSSIQEEVELHREVLQKNIKKLTQGIKKLITSEIDNNGYQEQGAEQYLLDLYKDNPIRIEICKQLFKERFNKELEVSNNYEADASPAINLDSSNIEKAFNELNLSYEKLLKLHSAHDVGGRLQSNNEGDRTQKSGDVKAVVPVSSLNNGSKAVLTVSNPGAQQLISGKPNQR